MATLEIDGREISFETGKTILEVALESDIYVPHLCYRPGLSPKGIKSARVVYRGQKKYEGPEETYKGCRLCIVEIEGKEGFFESCTTLAEDGMVVVTNTPPLLEKRREYLADLLEKHPHTCLLCPQIEGCDLKICSRNVPQEERCCWKSGICELQKVSWYIGLGSGLEPYHPEREIVDDNPLFLRDYTYCVGCLRCVVACREISGAGALDFVVVNGEVVVGSKGPTLTESGCKFCGVCVEVCPTGALSDKTDKTSLVPCKNSCPAGVDVPRYVQLVCEGKFDKAYETIIEKVPFPGILGRVCHAPCEEDCRRGKIDEPVSIKNLKRACSEFSERKRHLAPNKKTEKKVAIAGSGPAGLTCAFYLALLGHEVTVYEALPEVGGMLRVGIPPYRLPRKVLDEEFEELYELGVKVETGKRIESAKSLLSDGFDAVYLGLGVHKGRETGIEGEELEGVFKGLELLRESNLGRRIEVGKEVAIIGGGNVAVDSARVLIRKGVKNIRVFYRRTREEMPAFKEEIETALEEGIGIEFLVAPLEIERRNGKVSVKFLRMEMSEERDSSGRRKPVPVKGGEFNLDFDNVVLATGEVPDIPEGMRELSLDGERIWVDQATGMTKAEGVFAGGDVVTGPRTVIDAVAAGRKAAISIDRFLGGDGGINIEGEDYFKTGWNFSQGKRASPLKSLPEERVKGFYEVTSCLERKEAVEEAERCLRCSFRFFLPEPVTPPEKWILLTEENVSGVPEGEGVYELFDENRNLYKVAGVEDIKEALLSELSMGESAKFFTYEKEPMYTSRERQIIQQYMKEHGRLPAGNEEPDDLFS